MARVAGTLDDLLTHRLDEIQRRVAAAAAEPDSEMDELLAPIENQEVWAAGVTYERSREARMAESNDGDIYARVYEAERPELFFKAAGWRVVGSGGAVGIRSDSSWNVPEPELAVLCNRGGEIVAYTCGNDMSSRQLEGENPLYLSQAKIYTASCALGPAAVPAWEVDPWSGSVRMTIRRQDVEMYSGATPLSRMVRDAAQLFRVLLSHYEVPVGAWLLTGTGLVPDPPYTALPGDVVSVSIDGLGTLVNTVATVGPP